MNPNTIFAVLTDTELLLVGTAGEKRALQSISLPPQLSDLGSLIQRAVQAGLTSVWVMPGTRWSRDANCSLLKQVDRVWEVIASPSPLDPARPLCALVWRKLPAGRHGPLLSFMFPEHGQWGWRLPDATTLLATVTYLEHVLGVPLSCSPEQLALDLLTRLTLEQHAAWTRPSGVDLSSLPTSDGHTVPILESAREVVWMRPLTIAEWRLKYLHKYEHDALDLEACAAVQLGAGDPLYSANGRAYDGALPGIWRVNAETAGSVFDGKRLPSCLHGEWMSTPEVRCCTDLAYRVQVKEGYYWPESHRTLESWATTLGKARQRVQTFQQAQARLNALHTIKMITHLGVEKLADAKAPGGLYRPDWWAQIVGQRRANLFAHLVAFVRRGFMPVLVDRQAVWFVSHDPNPLTAVPGLVIPEKPGGYKAVYDAPLALSREVKEAFRMANSAGQLAMLLHALAEEEDEAVR